MSCSYTLRSFKIFISILLLGLSATAEAQKLTIYMEEWPPYHFTTNDKIVGISTELLELALKKSGIEYEFVIRPFKRALRTVQRTPNTMCYTVARIPQREDMFIWIGPLHPRKVYLYKLKKRTDIQIDSLDDIKKYHTGVLSGGSIELFFIAHGFGANTYVLLSKSEQLLRMLFEERIDLIPGDPLDLAYQMKGLGYNYSRIEAAYLLAEEGGYYIAANKDTSAEIITKLQKSLEEVMATGVKEQIIQKYVH